VTPLAATILHVDLDAFFAAVEQRDRPELRGKPVIVGGGDRNARGVVSAASYEARVFGVRSAMPLRSAAALCPQGIFVPVDGAKYASVSRQVMAILRGFSPLVEPVSIDEAFLDLAGTETLLGTAGSVASGIKTAIRRELDLTASVGVATTKLVAKVASELRKPDGLVIVEPGTEAAFLSPLPIERLWGVGARTRAVLTEYGVKTIGDLAALPVDILVRRFGNGGPQLAARALGIDPSPVGDGVAAKSVSHEHTFGVDTADWEVIERTLLALSEGVAGRLRAAGLRAGTVAVRLRDSEFVTISRQRTLKSPTDLTEPIWRTALGLVRPEVRGMRVRLLGVAASHLTDREQLALFGEEDGRRRRAVEASDAIRDRFGTRAITRARLLRSGIAAPFERDYQTAPDAQRIGSRPVQRRDTGAGTRPVDDAHIDDQTLDTEHPFD
jgi:DNA polymerase-4